MKSIRWKIIILCAVAILVPLLILNSYTIRTFDEFTRRGLEDQMTAGAFAAGESYKEALAADGSLPAAVKEQLAEKIGRYSVEFRERIQILSAKGIVLLDSEDPTTEGSDLSTLPEVRVALGGRYKARYALTPDRRYMYYYCALPLECGQGVCGVAYVSRHTGHIMDTIKEMIYVQRITLGAAIGAGVLLSGVLAWTISNRLRRLTSAATAFARTGKAIDVKIGGRDEVAELAEAIRRMAEDLQRTNRYNREFISTVMHELKMPITAIKGAAELLDEGAFGKKEARDKFLGNIRFEADRLARLVWELNELTKLDTESPHVQKERVEYAACVRDIVDRFITTLDQPHPAITVRAPEKKIEVLINPGRIEQVIGNLLDNAVRYTPATGTIEVIVEERQGGTVVTSVKDTGCGIAASNLPKVFERFFTTEPKDKPKDYGSGLGLAIAKSIVENHHGTIRVESIQGHGATFSFTLPPAGK